MCSAMNHDVDTVIIGAGISGLATAHWLRKGGQRVMVFERNAEVGGTMKSILDEGFLCEEGPNSALETTPLIRELVDDLGLKNEFLYANPSGKKRFILRKGRLYELPLSPQSFITTPAFSLPAKLRLLAEPFIGKATSEESIAEFVVRRLGREFLDYAIDPFVAGIYAGKPELLSVQAAFPKLYALEQEHGSLIRGMFRKRSRGEKLSAEKRGESFSFRSGMQQLPRAIASRMSHAVVCGVEDVRLETTNDRQRYEVHYRVGGNLHRVEAKHVVLAVPAFAAAELVRAISPRTADVLASVRCAPVASVFTGFRADDVNHPLDGFGFLVPALERRTILGCLWSSSLFPGRAPAGAVAFTTFVGGLRQPELVERDDRELQHLVVQELKSLMHITGNPVYWRVSRIERAIPQYEVGYGKTLAEFLRFETKYEGLHFCSNFRGGIAVGDCVVSAHGLAQRILRHSHTGTMNNQGA